MNVTTFLRQYADQDNTNIARFNEFDPSRFDYTLKIRKPDGQLIMLRNPKEAEEDLIDKNHYIQDGCELLAMGTAFWDWTSKKQHTVGIDIDTNDGHANGLSPEQCLDALEAAKRVPWLEVRRSSGGKGLHVFPRFSEPIDVANREEASSLAKGVLTVASRVAGFDFKAVKDCAGSNMWIFKSDAPPIAYEVIKEATASLDDGDLPPGWREVVKASKRKVQFAPSNVDLSPDHLVVEKQLQGLGYTLIYVRELGCYHVHTHALQAAHRLHNYRGHFSTVSNGEHPGEPNAYMFPLTGGGFLVKRFNNAKEADSWFDGPNGQYALLNVVAPFYKAVTQFATNSTTKGYSYTYDRLCLMLKAIGVPCIVPAQFQNRTIFLKPCKDEARMSVDRHDSDSQVEEWTATNNTWQKSFQIPPMPDAFSEAGVVRVSDIVRAVSTDTESSQWCVRADEGWIGTTASEVRNVLTANDLSPSYTMGKMRLKPYRLVFEPFQPEYLSGRRWNREAPQLACQPAEEALDTPTWDAVFNHLGSGLDEDIAADTDCREVGITSGAQYLKLWVKLLIEKPEQRTPYLFLTSRQNNTGKTSLGASLCHLINPGVAEINEEALVDKFTGELEGKVLCLIEELDLRDKRNKAYATLKRVLTSSTLTIRRMRTDAYTVPNFTHFIHTANDARCVPCETEDMRIVIIDVGKIEHPIDSLEFDAGIKREAPSMLKKLADLALPERRGRFWLPVVQSALKEKVLTGQYETETTDAEEGLKQFATQCIKKSSEASAPCTEVLNQYAQFCIAERFPPVAKMAFAKTLNEKLGFAIDRKQVRLGKSRPWHYTGIELTA